MTSLTSFSYELIVVCTHELCPGSWLPLCLIRSRSNAQCSLGEESEAQVMHPLMFYLVFVAKTPVCPGSSLTSLGQFFRVAVPNHFGPSDWLCGRQFFHGPGLGE